MDEMPEMIQSADLRRSDPPQLYTSGAEEEQLRLERMQFVDLQSSALGSSLLFSTMFHFPIVRS
jgi:hypothetical protein